MGSSNTNRDNDFKYNDSDVDIISNPSQSSIEVLDPMQHSSRKTSEERRISQIPSLETIEDDPNYSQSFIVREFGSLLINRALKDQVEMKNATATEQNLMEVSEENKPTPHLASFNLTESSSSGSVTDSICTAYEQQANKTLINYNKTTSSNEIRQASQNLVEAEQKYSAPSLIDNNTNGQKRKEGISSMFGGMFFSNVIRNYIYTI